MSSSTNTTEIIEPFRLLHWVHKIGNYETSRAFYEQVLNMKEQRHEHFDAGCEAACNGRYQNRWTKTMIGYGSEDKHFVLELTANFGIKSYKLGNDFNQIVIHSDDKKETVTDPDGYKYQLVNRNEIDVKNEYEHDLVQYVSLFTSNVKRQTNFYTGVLGMKIFHESEGRVILGYANDQAKIEFLQLKPEEELVHGQAFGRLAVSSKIDIKTMHKRVLESKQDDEFATSQVSIVKEPVVLSTPGKADVEVVIISDCDGYEICFAEEVGFLALALGQ